MPRGYRSVIIAAVIGLAVTAFGLGAYVTAVSYPEDERYQSYSDSQGDQANPPLAASNLPKAAKRNTPCRDPQNATESDLCAQWRAAIAAEDTFEWTAFGVLASIAGIIGLYWQIALTREAVKDTGQATEAMLRANEIAEKMGQAQVRAYVSIIKATWTFTPEFSEAAYIFEMENSGSTPAKNVRIFGRTILFDDGKLAWAGPIPEMKRVAGIDMPAGFKWNMRHISFGENLDLKWGDWSTNRLSIYLTTWLIYNDVFGNEIVDVEDWQVVRVIGEPRPVVRIDRTALSERDVWPTE